MPDMFAHGKFLGKVISAKRSSAPVEGQRF